MITNLTSISVYNLCRLNKWVVLLMSLIQFSSQLRRLPNLLRRLVDRLIHFHCFHALFTFLQTCVMELNCLSLLSGSYWQVHHAFSVPYCLWCNCHYCGEGNHVHFICYSDEFVVDIFPLKYCYKFWNLN